MLRVCSPIIYKPGFAGMKYPLWRTKWVSRSSLVLKATVGRGHYAKGQSERWKPGRRESGSLPLSSHQLTDDRFDQSGLCDRLAPLSMTRIA